MPFNFGQRGKPFLGPRLIWTNDVSWSSKSALCTAGYEKSSSCQTPGRNSMTLHGAPFCVVLHMHCFHNKHLQVTPPEEMPSERGQGQKCKCKYTNKKIKKKTCPSVVFPDARWKSWYFTRWFPCHHRYCSPFPSTFLGNDVVAKRRGKRGGLENFASPI